MKKSELFILLGVGSLLLRGCAHHHERERVVYTSPAPVVVERHVVVTKPPPPLRRETVVVSPGPGYVWVNGNWIWRGNRYVREKGRWVRPPHARTAWVAPRYESHGNSYYYYNGYWR